MLIQLLGMAIGFSVHVMLARSMGSAEYGTYVVALSWMMLLLLLCRMGLGTGSLRFVSQLSASESWAELRGFLRFSNSIVLGASLIVALATASLVWALSPRFSPSMQTTLWVVCGGLPIYAFLQTWSSVLRGMKRVVLSQFAISVLQPLILALAMGAFLVFGTSDPEAPLAMALTVVAAACALLFSGAAIRRARPPALRDCAPETHANVWLRVTIPLMLINVLNLLLERSDILLLGFLLGPEEAGLYAPARRIATLMAIGLTAVAAWAAPLISDLHTRGRFDELQVLVKRAAQLVFIVTLPIAFVIVLWGPELLGLFGSDFEGSYPALAILAAGQLVNALVGPVGLLLTMTGHQTAAAKILFSMAAANILLNATLIPSYGLEGAAVATASTRAGLNLLMAWTVWRRLHLRAMIL